MLIKDSERIPDAFYKLTHPARWVDQFATADGKQRLVLTPWELDQKAERERHYVNWLNRHNMKSLKVIFQAIQVLNDTSPDGRNSNNWWPPFRDCVFRVFVNPYTEYCERTKDWRQWYVLAPEDSEMIKRWQLKRKGITTPPRNPLEGEKWISRDRRVNKLLAVPTACCRHWRHETTAGALPVGL